MTDTAVNQRHHLVLLFTDLSDSTRIAATMEPEVYAELLNQLRLLLSDIVQRHGGEIVRIDGDGAICIFGYPLAYEDSGRRATEAALDLHEAMAALDGGVRKNGRPIRLHSGIHAGTVLLRSGDMVRGRYEMLGNATNVAARLCDAAGADGIMVSEGTLGADHHFFRSRARRDIIVSGQPEPVRVHAITGRSDVPNRFAARSLQGITPFIGRQAEQAELARWLAGASDIEAPIMLLHGPPGIGKSRMIGESAGRAAQSGWQVARGFCEHYLGARPLQPFLHIASEIDPRHSPADPDSVADALGALIVQTAVTVPLLLIIDDWQWADDASRELLAHILADDAAPPGRLRIMLASREADGGLGVDQPMARIALPPLDPAAASAAIGGLLATPDPFAIARIEAAAGGSPLLIEELCHEWQAGGDRTPDSDPRGSWFDLAVQARFGLLPPEESRLLRMAAVIGHYVPTWLLAAVHGKAIDAAMLIMLQEADFLFPGDSGGMLRFKHGLTRDAVYAGIGLAERRTLHAQVLAALEERAGSTGDEALLDALAYHSGASGDGIKALPYAMRAGDAALTAGALDIAQMHYRAAFALVETMADGPERNEQCWALLNKFGLVCIIDPAPDQLPVFAAVIALLQASGDVPGLVRSAYWMGAIAYGLGSCALSVAYLREALVLAEAHGQYRFFGQIRTKLAQSLFACGRYAESDALFRDVLPEIRTIGARNDREALTYALCCHGFLLADQGFFADSRLRYFEAESVHGSQSSPMLASCLTQRAAVALWRGEWLAAQDFAAECLANSKRTRARYQSMMSHALAAYGAWQVDRSEAAVATLEAAARWFLGQSNSKQRTSLVHGWLADIMAERGDRAAARHHSANTIQRVRHGGDRLGEGMAWRALARVEARMGNPARADHYAAMALRSANIRQSQREAAQAWLCMAGLAVARGDDEAASRHALAAQAAFQAMDMPVFAEQAARIVTNR